ncbi:hypothetical protein CPC08DRAFT_788273 [Agrocybe pediades]|nr:hypothetical protein CPC08DRAFT_788273 [Agrocybe pediades]
MFVEYVFSSEDQFACRYTEVAPWWGLAREEESRSGDQICREERISAIWSSRWFLGICGRIRVKGLAGYGWFLGCSTDREGYFLVGFSIGVSCVRAEPSQFSLWANELVAEQPVWATLLRRADELHSFAGIKLQYHAFRLYEHS